jgi:UrcA family protein
MNVAKLVTTSLIVGASVLGVAVSSPVLAGPLTNTIQIAVDYADLDLTTRDGLEVLHRRIVAAARTVCPAPRNADVRLKGLARECRTQAIEGALRSIGNAELAALHAAGRDRG